MVYTELLYKLFKIEKLDKNKCRNCSKSIMIIAGRACFAWLLGILIFKHISRCFMKKKLKT